MRAVGASTVVAEFLAALAAHRAAAVAPLDPVLALGALLKLGAAHELLELLVVLAEAVGDLVLGAGHAPVVLAPAAQAVVLVADRALVVVQALLAGEDAGAAR